jgi:hypothetical protein
VTPSGGACDGASVGGICSAGCPVGPAGRSVRRSGRPSGVVVEQARRERRKATGGCGDFNDRVALTPRWRRGAREQNLSARHGPTGQLREVVARLVSGRALMRGRERDDGRSCTRTGTGGWIRAGGRVPRARAQLSAGAKAQDLPLRIPGKLMSLPAPCRHGILHPKAGSVG